MQLQITLLSHFGSTSVTVRQGPVIYHRVVAYPDITPRRAHPCRGGISIWKPIRGGIGPETGLFKVYPGSQHLSTLSELSYSGIRATEVRIRADQVLITHGGLWIEEQRTCASGSLMWMGVSERVLGLYIDIYCPQFIAEAYGATRLLSRRPSLEGMGLEPELQIAKDAVPFTPQDRITGGGLRSRAETLDSFLSRALTDLPLIDKFVNDLDDPTGLILCAYHRPSAAPDKDKDPRMALLKSKGPASDPTTWFIRALAVRYLVQRYHNPTSRSMMTEFIREQNLPDTPALRNNVKQGHKIYLVEIELQMPGIWLALSGIFPRVTNLPFSEVYSLPQALRGQYSALGSAAQRWSRLMEDSSCLYSTWIDELLEDMTPDSGSRGIIWA
ncbi:uncharacterized protein DSM5745_01766 [Aspergillus mulundensis]|uniref:Uncharacterized protein n=1 Tax=Aspergillus mulundensis TaxID=1810919 RepID=A0A3D8SUY1_9EURO|nr:hypothetical protein DSM5745_01766 [Aspergillus mulundensis]RDW89991.1 hypothetical protein DSM5745_01766 [Aspergillus mulundensis]